MVFYCSRVCEEHATDTEHSWEICSALAAITREAVAEVVDARSSALTAKESAEGIDAAAEAAGTAAEAAAEATEVRWLRIRQMQIAELEVAAADSGVWLSESDMMPVVLQRVCVVCKTHVGVSECEACGVATFCQAHERRVRDSHAPVCSHLALALHCEQAAGSLHADAAADLDTLLPSGVSVEAEAVELRREVASASTSTSADAGWDDYFRARPHAPPEGPTRCQLAQTLSLPLTLAHAVRRLGCDEASRLVVHVLGAAAYPELTELRKWEHALHALPHVRTLELVMVGPDAVLPFPSGDEIAGCDACRLAGRCVRVRTHVAPYHEFAAEGGEAPQLAVAFNSGVHEGARQWEPTLRHLIAARVPTALTAYSAWEAEQDAAVVRRCIGEVEGAAVGEAEGETPVGEAAGKHHVTVTVEPNPYHGLRPYIDPRASLGVFRMNSVVIWLEPCS